MSARTDTEGQPSRPGGFRDECGVFGIFGHSEAANLSYLGLHALQHRGQESAGIVSCNGSGMHAERRRGQVADTFDEEALRKLEGDRAIGHVRYSTAGGSSMANAQPLKISSHRGDIAVCHNGNLVNARIVRERLEREGSIFATTSDTEVILHLIARSRQPDLEDAVVDALRELKGAYSLAFLTADRMIAVRDPMGFRPLSLGKLDGAWIVTSESCALDLIGGKFERDVAPGEVVVVQKGELRSYFPFEKLPVRQCVFEHVYFSRPDSVVFGRAVGSVRKRFGAQLAREHPADADVVVPVPDSGLFAAQGFAEESGIPFEFGLVRNHYIGRTFIEPEQSIRNFGVKLKLNPVRHLLEGKRVVLVDDSIVRGTTSRKIVTMVRQAGAAEVHMRVSCPPTVGPCYYGVDTPTRGELIAATHSVEEIRKHIRADSLGYLSLEGMLAAVDGDHAEFCTACYTNDYPIRFPEQHDTQLDLL
ncbi:MAG: amidophosphoribosyltransferase [Acidobacteriota bacterium]|jgi:amidophosphoribosyltransferase